MAKKNLFLVPVDFSAQSLIALEQASNLAKSTDASLLILYVIEHGIFNSIFTTKTAQDKHRKSVTKKLEALTAKTIKASGLASVDNMVADGKVYQEIVDVAKKVKAKYVVMAKSEENHFIGSNTLRVVKESPCPVITIKGTLHRPNCKNIVLPLDLNKETREKVSKAVDFAKHFNSTVHVVAIEQMVDEILSPKLMVILNQVKHHLVNHGVKATAEMIHADDIAKSVIDYSKRVKADLVLIMTQEELDFTEFFIGSSAQQIINHCDIPVMSIRPSGKEYSYTYSPIGLHS